MTKQERKEMSNIIFKTGIAMIFAGMSIGALLINLLNVPGGIVASMGIIAAVIKLWPYAPEEKFLKELAEDGKE